MSQTQETLTLDRLLEPVSRCLTPEAAQRLVELRADPKLQERIDTLADRCTEGQLTPEESEEYDNYIRVSRFIAILQAKARRLLAQHPSS
jgi:hypothetical protein